MPFQFSMLKWDRFSGMIQKIWAYFKVRNLCAVYNFMSAPGSFLFKETELLFSYRGSKLNAGSKILLAAHYSRGRNTFFFISGRFGFQFLGKRKTKGIRSNTCAFYQQTNAAFAYKWAAARGTCRNKKKQKHKHVCAARLNFSKHFMCFVRQDSSQLQQ